MHDWSCSVAIQVQHEKIYLAKAINIIQEKHVCDRMYQSSYENVNENKCMQSLSDYLFEMTFALLRLQFDHPENFLHFDRIHLQMSQLQSQFLNL